MSLAETAGWIVAGIAGAGIVLTIVGRRGKLVDDHPLCAKCRFDLFGLPDDHPRCPECGKALSNPVRKDAIIGNRAKRPVVMWAGVFMLLVVLVPALVVGAGAARGNAYGLQPVFVLRYLAEGPDFGVRAMATKELERRLTVGDLSQEQIDGIADRFIAIHAGEVADFKASAKDPAGPVEVPMLAWLEAAESKGVLSASRRDRLLDAAARLLIDARPVVRRGDPLPVHIVQHIQGLQLRAKMQFRFEASIDGMVVQLPSLNPRFGPPYAATLETFRLPASDPVLAALSIGPHVLQINARVQVLHGSNVVTTDRRYQLPFEVIAPDQSSARAVDVDPKVLSEVRLNLTSSPGGAFAIDFDVPSRHPGPGHSGWQLAGRVVIWDGKRLWDHDKIVDDNGIQYRIAGPKPDFHSELLTVYLVPDASAAALGTTVRQYQRDILRFDKVPITDEAAARSIVPEILPPTEENLRRLRLDD